MLTRFLKIISIVFVILVFATTNNLLGMLDARAGTPYPKYASIEKLLQKHNIVDGRNVCYEGGVLIIKEALPLTDCCRHGGEELALGAASCLCGHQLIGGLLAIDSIRRLWDWPRDDRPVYITLGSSGIRTRGRMVLWSAISRDKTEYILNPYEGACLVISSGTTDRIVFTQYDEKLSIPLDVFQELVCEYYFTFRQQK